MRRLYRFLWLPLYRRWALWFIRSERGFRYAGLQLAVPPGVFHPGVFFSTPVFLSFLQDVDFQEKTVLDVGTGSGILALFTAGRGGLVTAIDINPEAVETARKNAGANGLDVRVIQSDLFEQLPLQPFDFVLINPPYYPLPATDTAGHAFFAGLHFEYFERLFDGLNRFVSGHSKTWMILSEDCDFGRITEIAGKNGIALATVFERKKWGERFFVVECAFDKRFVFGQD